MEGGDRQNICGNGLFDASDLRYKVGIRKSRRNRKLNKILTSRDFCVKMARRSSFLFEHGNIHIRSRIYEGGTFNGFIAHFKSHCRITNFNAREVGSKSYIELLLVAAVYAG